MAEKINYTHHKSDHTFSLLNYKLSFSLFCEFIFIVYVVNTFNKANIESADFAFSMFWGKSVEFCEIDLNVEKFSNTESY